MELYALIQHLIKNKLFQQITEFEFCYLNIWVISLLLWRSLVFMVVASIIIYVNFITIIIWACKHKQLLDWWTQPTLSPKTIFWSGSTKPFTSTSPSSRIWGRGQSTANSLTPTTSKLCRWGRWTGVQSSSMSFWVTWRFSSSLWRSWESPKR